MHRPRALLFRLAAMRALVLGVLVASCMAPVPTPTATPRGPATPEATGPGSPTPAPTLAATSPPLGAAWAAATGLGDADILDVGRGPLGWVAAGTTCDDCAAAAWFSEDGLDWSGGAIPNDSAGTSWVSSVAAHGSAWVAAGGRLEGDGGSAAVSRALIWRSKDGRTWSLADTILLGRCLEGCPLTSTPAATTSAAIPATATVQELGSPLTPRIQATAVWTGHEVILWGGAQWEGTGVSGPLGDGAAYDPAADTWRMLPEAPIDPRAGHIAGWTGNEVLVWGGYTGGGEAPAPTTGAAYNPTTGDWRTLPPAPINWSDGAASVWADGEWVIAIVPDGTDAVELAAYNPSLDRWRELPRLPGPFSVENRVAWTGSELLIVNVADGLFRLDPDGGTWIPNATPAVWGPVVWTGDRLLGVADGNPYWSLVEWDPSTGDWSEIPMPESALLREAELVWTGDRAIFPTSGLAFNPSTSQWWTLDPPAAIDRSDTVILWAGDRVLLLGGWPGGPSEPIPFGAAYVPAW